MTPIERPRSNSQDSSDRDDLNWTAMLYASGELAGSELEVFEQRLAGDTAACEAVGRAVLLARAAVEAFNSMPETTTDPSPAKVQNGPGFLRPRHVVAGLAASAAAVTAAALISGSFIPAPDTVVQELETRQVMELLHEWSSAGASINSVLADARDSLPGDLSDELADTSVPEWMLIAVQASTDSREAQVMEN